MPCLVDGVDARLHVVGAEPARLQRVDAHHLVLGEADLERLDRVAALELPLGGALGHEPELLLGVRQEVGDVRQRPLGRRGLHLGHDLGDVGRQLRALVLRRIGRDVVLGRERLAEQAPRLAGVALGLHLAPVGAMLAVEVAAGLAVGEIGLLLRRGEALRPAPARSRCCRRQPGRPRSAGRQHDDVGRAGRQAPSSRPACQPSLRGHAPLPPLSAVASVSSALSRRPRRALACSACSASLANSSSSSWA